TLSVVLMEGGSMDVRIMTPNDRLIGTLRLHLDGVSYRRASSKRSLDDVRVAWGKLDDVLDVFRD
ncbi:hypothetical protein R0J87_20485, partial [Halomonas sp. SIMBA_159]